MGCLAWWQYALRAWKWNFLKACSVLLKTNGNWKMTFIVVLSFALLLYNVWWIWSTNFIQIKPCTILLSAMLRCMISKQEYKNWSCWCIVLHMPPEQYGNHIVDDELGWLACRLLTAVCVWANIWIFFFWMPATLFFLTETADWYMSISPLFLMQANFLVYFMLLVWPNMCVNPLTLTVIRLT